jgi:hypothetical protein
MFSDFAYSLPAVCPLCSHIARNRVGHGKHPSSPLLEGPRISSDGAHTYAKFSRTTTAAHILCSSDCGRFSKAWPRKQVIGTPTFQLGPACFLRSLILSIHLVAGRSLSARLFLLFRKHSALLSGRNEAQCNSTPESTWESTVSDLLTPARPAHLYRFSHKELFWQHSC